MSESAPTAALYAALAKAQGDARSVAHDARNEHHQFNYTSAEAIIRDTRKPLSDNGLSLIRSKCECVVTDGGGVLVKSWFILTHAEGGSHEVYMELPAIEGKGRPIDKAILGVQTSLLGYVLRDLLLAPRGLGEEEVSARDDRDHEPARAVNPKPSTKTQAAIDKGKANKDSEEAEAFETRLQAVGRTVSDIRAYLVKTKVVKVPKVVDGAYTTWPDWAKDAAWKVLEAKEREAAAPIPEDDVPF
ncbi:MAG: ERF family protein [Gemmatimonadetes bacterium]|nr:ERF family protein [Gemmatimonadota bacterium]